MAMPVDRVDASSLNRVLGEDQGARGHLAVTPLRSHRASATRELRDSHRAPGISSRTLARDGMVIHFVASATPYLLRLSVALVFVWFGGLKLFGASPVEGLVADTVHWIDYAWLVPALGILEIAIGIGLITGRLVRPTLILFTLQMLGTFLVFLVQPEVAFQHGNLLLLTMEGEFVVKNLVLFSAGLVVGSRMWYRDRLS